MFWYGKMAVCYVSQREICFQDLYDVRRALFGAEQNEAEKKRTTFLKVLP